MITKTNLLVAALGLGLAGCYSAEAGPIDFAGTTATLPIERVFGYRPAHQMHCKRGHKWLTRAPLLVSVRSKSETPFGNGERIDVNVCPHCLEDFMRKHFEAIDDGQITEEQVQERMAP